MHVFDRWTHRFVIKLSVCLNFELAKFSLPNQRAAWRHQVVFAGQSVLIMNVITIQTVQMNRTKQTAVKHFGLASF